MGFWQNVAQSLGLTVPDAAPVVAATELARAAQLPATQGDVAQVADMPPEVGAAFGVGAGAPGGTISRREAMRVPAFARGRNTICGTIGTLDLFAVKGPKRQDDRALLVQPDLNATAQFTLTWTVDDLLCRGIAWWRVTDRDTQDFPLHAEWVRRDRVTVEGEHVYVDGKQVETRDMIRFDGPHEGVLSFGADVLRAAIALEQAVKRFAEKPAPTVLLVDQRPVDSLGRELTDDEKTQLVTDFGDGNPFKYLNRSLRAEPLGWDPTQLDLTAARQQAAVQVARLLGMPSRQVNAPSESSMQYSTTVMDRQELIDGPLSMYLTAIEQRLSMPDVTPRGWRVRFDRDGFTKGTTADRLKNAETFVSAKLGPVSEARVRYLDLPPTPDGYPPDPAPPAATPPAPQEQP